MSTFIINREEIPQTQLELKIKCNFVVEEKPIWERFSTMSRMKRVLAYCKRILKKERKEYKEKHLQVNRNTEYIRRMYKILSKFCIWKGNRRNQERWKGKG